MRKILNIGPVVAAAALVGAGVLAAACGSEDEGDGVGGGADTPVVVVTTSILGDVVAGALAGLDEGDVEVEVIMPIGADPHDFSPSAQQAEAMEQADLLVVNGLGLEEGMSDVIDVVADTGTPVFTFADHVAVRSLDDEHDGDEHDGDEHDGDEHDGDEHDGDEHAGDEHAGDEHDGDEHDGDEHDHGNDDPHLWMDPTQVIAGLGALGEELTSLGIDPPGLESSIAAYLDELATLDAEIESTLASIPDDRRVLVTNHDSFGYFADRYGFQILGTVIPSLTTSSEASAADLERLAELIREAGVSAIFAETTESDRLAEALADEVGGDVEVVELYTGSLGESGSTAETYVGMMQTNAERIAAALG